MTHNLANFISKKSVKTTSLAILVLAIAGVGCTTRQVPQSSESSSSDALLIGEVSSMTGAEATYGMNAHQGIALAIQEINEAGGVKGKKLKLLTLDSQGKPDESTRALTKLISKDKVSAVLAGVISSNALAMAPIAQQNKIPFVATIATHPKVTTLGDYIFRVCLMDSFQGKVMAKFALENLKVKKVAILRDVKSDYSIGLSETFTSVIREGGGEIVMSQTYTANDNDFKSQLTAVRAKNPEAIFIPGYYTDVSLIARQARELGMNIPLLGGDGWDSPKLKEIGGEALTGSYFVSFYSAEQATPSLKAFIERYKKAYGAAPDGLALGGYEGAQVLADAIRRAKTLDSVGIRDALAQSEHVATASGEVSMDQKRDAIRSAVVQQIEKNGNLKYQATVNP